jgi:hypothetical protein
MDYQREYQAALQRRQTRLCREAEQAVAPFKGIRCQPSQAVLARQADDAASIAVGLCPHGKVPRLVAAKMAMPRLGCQKCA